MKKQANESILSKFEIVLPKSAKLTLNDEQIKAILADYVQKEFKREVEDVTITYDYGRYGDGDGTNEAEATITVKL